MDFIYFFITYTIENKEVHIEDALHSPAFASMTFDTFNTSLLFWWMALMG